MHLCKDYHYKNKPLTLNATEPTNVENWTNLSKTSTFKYKNMEWLSTICS